jgi:hypothetical protein
MRSNEAFSSQVESLGGSENAIKRSIFKPSGITWRLGKCDQIKIQIIICSAIAQ